MPSLILAAQEAPPAGGSTVEEVLVASAVAFLAVALVVVIGVLHRRNGLLNPLARLVERRTGYPAWSAIPVGIIAVALITAVVGYYWDVSWHIDRGRDAGAFANPAHLLIVIGLDGVVFAGILALVLGDRKTATSIRIRPGWDVPVGGVLLTVCGLIALGGFPLDDIWHRVFGQDVTAWGPTHIQMIGGASLATLAAWALLVEGERCRTTVPSTGGGWMARLMSLGDVLLGGAFLIGLSTLQIEFNYGVPQFRQLFHPVLLMLAAGIALVAARIRVGRGGALGAVTMFIVLHAVLSFVITEPWGRSTLHFPLYLVEAVVVELVALRVPRARQLTFGLAAGLGIGTVGLAAEWSWSHLWMPHPWRAALLPEGIVLGLLAALCGGVLGGMVGRALAPDGLARQATPRGAAAAAAIGAFLCLAVPLPMDAHTDWQAEVTFEETGEPEGQAFVTLRLDPADAAEGANWFHAMAWQGRPDGDGGLVIADFERVEGSTYRTDSPVPLDDPWKTIVRLHTGSSLQSLPLSMPEDPAIPAEEVRIESGEIAPFARDKSVLQREATTDNVWLERGAYAVMALIALSWVASLAWGLRRLDPGPAGAAPRPEPELERT